MKRAFDICVASMGLVILAPLMIVIMAAVRVNLGAPTIFKQKRPGRNGVPFTLLKFRTMREVLDETGDNLPDHARLTTLGSFLRRASLDELPELINVLKGDMSLVGPRPLLMEYLPLYTREQARRHEVRPGITGWAQVNGRNTLSWEEKFRLDVWYVDHASFLLDLRILWQTFGKVLNAHGISHPGHATVNRFKGSQL